MYRGIPCIVFYSISSSKFVWLLNIDKKKIIINITLDNDLLFTAMR